MRLFTFIAILAIATISAVHNATAAAIKPKQFGSEGRFKTWTFYPNSIYYYTGYYMNPTYIEFDEGENVTTISTPKPTAWQFVPSGNRLFIKPVEEEADTTATIMTNKRIYFFEMHAEEAKGAFDNRVAFFVKFRYPQTQTATGDDDGSIIQYNTGSIPNLANPEDYNFNYTMSGDEIISPIATFDDGEFTYFQFKPNSPLPAVFPVDNDGMEGASNFRVAGDYIIVEKTGAVFTLRSGSATVCVYNENLIKNHPLAARTKNNTQTVWGSVKSLLNKNRS